MKRIVKKIAVGTLAAIMGLGSCCTNAVFADAVATQANSEAVELLNTAQALLTIGLSMNGSSISLLLGQALEKIEGNLAATALIQSAKALVDSGSDDAEKIKDLLENAKLLLSSTEEAEEEAETELAEETPEETTVEEEMTEAETEESTEEITEEELTTEEETTEEVETEEEINRPESNLTKFVQEKYQWSVLNHTISLQVPSDWGNNQSDSAITNYSPANKSGAITPQSGTLQTQYFAYDLSDEEAFAEYENGISKASSTSSFSVQDTKAAAGLDGRRIQYVMTLGANQFECEAVCFEQDQEMYVVQILQGNKRSADFYDVFDTSVGSIEIGIRENEPETESEIQSEAKTESEAEPESENQTEYPEETEPESEAAPDAEETLESFIYYINGHRYQFPTPVSDLAAGDLPIDTDDIVTYDIKADENSGGIFNELANTSYYFFSGSLCSELAGITNLSGYDIPASQGILTQLTDMQGSSVDVTLPGGVTVGAAESAVIAAFPQFQGMTLDGIAGFIGNDYLYACNVRDDGCNGYVIIKNNAPYYSTVSIICENGYVREICFECIGSIRANGVFLPE